MSAYGSPLSPTIHIVLPLAAVFAAFGTLFVIIALSTTAWEEIEWNKNQLRNDASVNETASYFDSSNGFYVVVTEQSDGNQTTSYLRDLVGGIWKICDVISENARSKSTFKTAKRNADFLKYDCFNYVTEYDRRKGELSKKAISLIRMQNSAASSSIVCLMCLTSAAIVGFLGVWHRQVTLVTVTGVLYVVAAVFVCFALTIMSTKVGYYRDDSPCYSIDEVQDKSLCKYRDSRLSWSIPIGWVSFCLLLVTFMLWLFLSRVVRLEKIKATLL